jgi:uncharacterized delta-60 repeat protein
MKNPTDFEGAPRRYIIPAAAIAAGLTCQTAVPAPGDLDPSFGNVGRVGALPGIEGAIWSLEASAVGAIVVGGGTDDEFCEYAEYYSYYYSCLDDGFAGFVEQDGRSSGAFADPSPDKIEVRDLARQSDRKVIAVGRGRSEFIHSFAVARFLPSGAKDESFGTAGGYVLPGAKYGAAYSVEVDGADRIVAAGIEDSQVVVLRLGKGGALDESFGTAGVFRGPFVASGRDHVEIEEAAGGYRVLSRMFDRCVVTALTASGQLDARFGQLGTATITSREGSVPICNAMAAAPDGSLTIGGHDDSGALALRLRPDGSPDPGFVGSDLQVFRSVTSLALESNGSAVLAITEKEPRPGALVVRVRPDGRIDPSFGVAGQARIELESNIPNVMRARVIRLQPDGRVLVGGTAARPPKPFLARLVATGGGSGVLGIVTASTEVSESDQRTTVRVGRSGGSTGAVSVRYETAGGSAQAGSDFSAVSGRLDWADGDVGERSITVPIVPGDASVEPPEQFTVVISRAEDRPSNARQGCGRAWIEWSPRGDGENEPARGLHHILSPGPAVVGPFPYLQGSTKPAGKGSAKGLAGP